MEILNGLGNLVGPLFGSMLYELGGYVAPFYGVSLIFTSILIFYKLFGNFQTSKIV